MTPEEPDRDPVVAELRGRITDADRTILATMNERIELVRTLREHKRANGWGFVDKAREERLLDTLAAENSGPLSDAGVRALFTELLDLTKRELGES